MRLGLLLALTGCVATATVVLEPGVETGETDEPPPPDADGDGFVDDEDCAPDDPEINPGAEERCDPEDWDCDGVAWSDAVCPCDVQVYDGMGAFYVACDDRVPWDDAREICADAGLQLVVIDDEPENLRVQTLFGDISPGGGWIGLSDQAREGFFEWVDGSGLRFRRWGAGHPVPADRFGREADCVSLAVRNGSWLAQYCFDAGLPFICELP